MKKIFSTMAASALVVSMILSGALVKRDTCTTVQATYTAQFRVAAEISPGGDVAAALPEVNTWASNSWIFMDVSIPTFAASEVELEADVVAGDWVPVLTFGPSPSWTLVQEEYGSVWRSVWMYNSAVDDGQQFTPLFYSWHMTNFRVRSGQCGQHSYEEIAEAINSATVQRYSLQADGISGTAEELWRMVSGE